MPSGVGNAPAYQVYHFVWCALDWLYPPRCGGCGQPGKRWCEKCQNQINEIGSRVCQLCGAPWAGPETICRKCVKRTPPFQGLRSYGLFKGQLREAIHRLKYQNDIGLGEALAVPMIDMVAKLGWQFDVVTAVPLSPQRLKERGYNQSNLLARPIAFAYNKPFKPQAIQRVRETHSQVGLSAVERLNNVQGAFQARGKDVTNQSILIIDDVATTGATMNACAQALLESGARSIYGLTLGRAE